MEAVVNALKEKAKSTKKKKRQVSFSSSMLKEDSSESESDYLYSNTEIETSFVIRTAKRANTTNTKINNAPTTEIVVELNNPKGKRWVLRGLLDKGTS